MCLPAGQRWDFCKAHAKESEAVKDYINAEGRTLGCLCNSLQFSQLARVSSQARVAGADDLLPVAGTKLLMWEKR